MISDQRLELGERVLDVRPCALDRGQAFGRRPLGGEEAIREGGQGQKLRGALAGGAANSSIGAQLRHEPAFLGRLKSRR